MSGFDPSWLALREPADHAAVNAEVRRSLMRHFQEFSALTIVDLGCGTGSNVRGLSPWLQQPQRWRLVDNDPSLLAKANERQCDLPPHVQIETVQADLALADIAELIDGCDLVTSAAFFDLASADLSGHVVRATAAAGVVFYTTLAYDGIASWLPEHPADGEVRRLFNHHQLRDKGLGPALGPRATTTLRGLFSALGYSVLIGPSPWVLGADQHSLRTALDSGWAEAVAETGALDSNVLADWRRHRMECDNAISIVGHVDLLALPPDRT